MELKTNYQYTYFVYPFIVEENKYSKYILKLLKNQDCQLKIFKKEKDLELYKYFRPEVRKLLFSSFDFTAPKLKSLQELPQDTQSAILAKYPCTMFEYNLENDLQGKTEETNGIFFSIRKMEIICFNTGVCFLAIKTHLENSQKFEDLLNFNYKFRDVNQEFKTKKYDNIKIQTDTYENVKTFRKVIEELTGADMENEQYNINTERFLTYSYTCLEADCWNEDNKYENIEYNFMKFSNILPSDNVCNFIKDESTTIDEWKYAKIGLTKQGVTLFSSATEINNFTVLPEQFENQYFYTYILNLYKRIYLDKLNSEFSNKKRIKKVREKFINFTRKFWIQEITKDEAGSILNRKLNEVLEIELLYTYTKSKYDVLYKEAKIEKKEKLVYLLAGVLLIAITLNIINFFR